MGVQIIILSGSRQAERLELDADEFRAGGDASCQIFFDPNLDAAAKGRVALLQKTEEGWCIRNAGAGELLLNQQAVYGRTRIRSGDIVRLSDHGPDFSFEIVTPAAAKRAVAAGDTAAAVTAKVDSPAEKTSETVASEPAAAAVVAEDILQSGVTAESTLPPLPPRRKSHDRAVHIVAAVAVVVLLLIGAVSLGLIVASRSDWQEDAAVAVSTQPHAADNKKDAVEPAESQPTAPPAENATDTRPGDATQDNETRETTARDATPADGWNAVARRLEKTTWLIEVGDADGRFTYPFATAVAVDEHLLLTTGAVAEELEKFRSKGWKIIAFNAAADKTIDIWKIRVHGVYADLAGKQDKQIYVNLGVLECLKSLGEFTAPASEAELAELDTGAELACMGISHQGDAMKPPRDARPDSLRPHFFIGKLFLRTKLDPHSPAGPRLLHFKAELGDNIYGSPIVNRDGHVVAVYAETAAGGEGKRLGLHYAPVLDRALIQAAIDGKEGPYWTPPRTPEKNPAGSESAIKNEPQQRAGR